MNFLTTQPVPLTRPPSASPMSIFNYLTSIGLYHNDRYRSGKPLHTEPASKSPIASDY